MRNFCLLIKTQNWSPSLWCRYEFRDLIFCRAQKQIIWSSSKIDRCKITWNRRYHPSFISLAEILINDSMKIFFRTFFFINFTPISFAKFEKMKISQFQGITIIRTFWIIATSFFFFDSSRGENPVFKGWDFSVNTICRPTLIAPRNYTCYVPTTGITSFLRSIIDSLIVIKPQWSTSPEQ